MAKPFPESGIAIRRSIRCFVFAVVFENTFELLAVAKARCYTSVARQQWEIASLTTCCKNRRVECQSIFGASIRWRLGIGT